MNSGAETPPERPLKTIEGAASFIPRFQYEVLFDIFSDRLSSAMR